MIYKDWYPCRLAWGSRRIHSERSFRYSTQSMK